MRYINLNKGKIRVIKKIKLNKLSHWKLRKFWNLVKIVKNNLLLTKLIKNAICNKFNLPTLNKKKLINNKIIKGKLTQSLQGLLNKQKKTRQPKLFKNKLKFLRLKKTIKLVRAYKRLGGLYNKRQDLFFTLNQFSIKSRRFFKKKISKIGVKQKKLGYNLRSFSASWKLISKIMKPLKSKMFNKINNTFIIHSFNQLKFHETKALKKAQIPHSKNNSSSSLWD
uniref:Uncharacterized protein n=1 Tax=Capsaspora owczarzaki TaxID=192875 RepID=M1JER3_9EUKA|nr:hypothetical protein [Capsaspora owczarzaki]